MAANTESAAESSEEWAARQFNAGWAARYF
jgi:hypothetical protein